MTAMLFRALQFFARAALPAALVAADVEAATVSVSAPDSGLTARVDAAGGGYQVVSRDPAWTFGGSLGTGRIHGLWHIIEGALQASGRAGSRQVKDVNVSFVGASAPIVTGTTFIFTREPY